MKGSLVLTGVLFFEPGNFLAHLPYLGIGMGVIFGIIGLIILCTRLISRNT